MQRTLDVRERWYFAERLAAKAHRPWRHLP
jgi:hypothetical protein